jgi:hypothetical protein
MQSQAMAPASEAVLPLCPELCHVIVLSPNVITSHSFVTGRDGSRDEVIMAQYRQLRLATLADVTAIDSRGIRASNCQTSPIPA